MSHCKKCEYKCFAIKFLLFIVLSMGCMGGKLFYDYSALKIETYALRFDNKTLKFDLDQCQEKLGYYAVLNNEIRQENGLITTEIVRLQCELNEMKINPKKWISENYKVYNLEVTAYSPSVDECDDTPFIAASGEWVDDFTIAVSQNMRKNGWDFGEFIYIPDHDQFYKINDVMNERFTKRIDVFKWTKEEARNFGFCDVDVYPIIHPDKIKDRRRVL